jgi:hypothetical protein
MSKQVTQSEKQRNILPFQKRKEHMTCPNHRNINQKTNTSRTTMLMNK